MNLRATHYCSQCKRPRTLDASIRHCMQGGDCSWVEAEKWAPELIITPVKHTGVIHFCCAMCQKPKTSTTVYAVVDNMTPEEVREPEIICNGCHGQLRSKWKS